MSWTEATTDYVETLRRLGRSPRTIEIVDFWLRRFVNFCTESGCTELSVVMTSTIATYQQVLLWEPGERGRLLSPRSTNRALEVVRSFFRWALAEGRVLVDPTRHLVLRRVRVLHRVLTIPQVAAILAAPDRHTILGLRDAALLELLYCTGLRRCECFRLDLDDLDLAGGTLRVRQGKGGHDRLVPLTASLGAALATYLDRARPALQPAPSERAIFIALDGARLTYAQLGRIVLISARKAGIDRPVGPHALRHAVATHLLENDADIREVQELLGHAHLQSTQTYTHLNPTEVRREHRRTHPRAKRRPPRDTDPGTPPPPSS